MQAIVVLPAKGYLITETGTHLLHLKVSLQLNLENKRVIQISFMNCFHLFSMCDVRTKDGFI
jgi:hypothetical protein